MHEKLDNKYFLWLCAKVLDNRHQNYKELLRIFYRTEFVWMPNVMWDENRAMDGVELRNNFKTETNTKLDPEWYALPASVLEVFIAFAYRAEFQTLHPVKWWFWKFMENLKLDEYRDVGPEDLPEIEQILNIWMWRTYDYSGKNGGMFPLEEPDRDQRQVEIWYQFCRYLIDTGMID